MIQSDQDPYSDATPPSREAAFLQAALDAMTAQVALLDEAGDIVAVNRAWRDGAPGDGASGDGAAGVGAVVYGTPGENYLAACDTAAAALPQAAPALAQAVRRLLDGRESAVSFEYECGRAGQTRWFRATLTRIEQPGPARVTVSYEETTAQRRVHDLERELRQYELILNSVNEGIHRFDSEGRITFENAAALKMLDWEAGDLFGRPSHETIHGRKPDGAPYPVEECPIYATLRDRSIRRVDNEVFQRRDGSLFPVEYSSTAICNENGESEGVVVSFRDITERRRAEELQERLTAELRHEHQRLDDMLANVPGVVWEAYGTPAGAMPQLGYASPSVETMLGYSVEEWLSTPNFWLICMHPEDRERALREAEQSFARGNAGTSRYRWITKDGRALWVEAHSTPIRDRHGNPVGMRGVTMDITERVRAEEERDRFFNLSLDFLCIGGFDGHFKRVSPSFAAALGFSKEELLVRPLMEFIHPDDLEETQRIFSHLSSGRAIDGFQNRYLTRDGGYRWLEWRAVPVPEEQLLYGAARDITGRKETEAALQRMRDELEERVCERTAELAEANAGLEQAKREADEAREAAEVANRAKSEFLSRMSHELRTPLNAILGFGQVLEMRQLGPREQPSVAHILRAGRHLLALINEVLDISRIESGSMALAMEVVDVPGCIATALDLVRPLASARRIEIVNETGGQTGWHVRADRQRLTQVLLNVLANAIKYNREEGRVTIRGSIGPAPAAAPGAASAPAGGEWLSISISDTGEGLTPGELSRLFIPFERLGAEQRGIEGTGIGLALSRQLVEVMGGSLCAESTPGEGSTFSIMFPLDREAAPGVQAVQRSLPEPAAVARKSTVLYIEDNLSNFTLVQHLLEREASITLLSAMQGSIGLDLAHQHHPDLILLDLHLPDIGGEEVLRRLRAAPDTKDIPVVVLSADATATHINRLLQAGVEGYLTKPLDIIQFAGVVTKVLNERGAE